MTKLSFEQMRIKMDAAKGQVIDITAPTTSRVVAAVKSVASAVQGVLPVTNNKLDARTEEILRIVERNGVELDNLYGMLGMNKPTVATEAVEHRVRVRMEDLTRRHRQPALLEATTAPVAVPVALEAPVAPIVEEVVVAPTEVKEEPVAPAPQVIAQPPSDPMANRTLVMSQPSNWHLGEHI